MSESLPTALSEGLLLRIASLAEAMRKDRDTFPPARLDAFNLEKASLALVRWLAMKAKETAHA